MRARRWIPGLLVVAAVTAACGRPPANEIVVTGADDGKSVEAHPGDTIRVRLESNPTTGYEWSVAHEPDAAVVTSAGHRYEGPEQQMPGAGGTEEWTFKAAAAGKTTLELVYARPFEEGQPPAQTFSVTFSVTAP